MIWAEELPYFRRSELACKGSGIIKMDQRFASALPYLRESWGRSLVPSSVCRSPDHNVAVGGHYASWHLTDNPERPSNGCMAADIMWRMWSRDEKLQFARHAYKLGWTIGLHDGFVHVDWRNACPGWRKTVFLYGTWNGFSPEEVR